MEARNHKESGFSLLELILTAGLSSFIFIGSSVFVGQTLSLSIKQKSQIDLMDFKRLALSHLNNDLAFKETSDSSEFSCLVTNTCTASQSFNIKTAYGSTHYDSTSPTQGLNENGVICDSYPSADCSIRLEVSFTDVCSSCDTKLIRINGELVASDLATEIIGNTNLKKFSFEILRNVSSASGVSLPVPAAAPTPAAPFPPSPGITVTGNTPPTAGSGGPPIINASGTPGAPSAVPTTPTSSPPIPPVAGNTPPTNNGGASVASNDPCFGPNGGDFCENNDDGSIRLDANGKGVNTGAVK